MLKLKYEDKSEIPEGAEKFYSEQDGAFVLQADDVKSNADVANLKEALDKERELRRDAESEVKKYEKKYSLLPDDFSIDEYNSLKDKAGGDIDAKLKEQRERITEQHNKELERLKSELSEKDNLVTTHVKNAQLQQAMNQAGIAKQFVPAVEAMMRDKIQVEGTDVYLNEKPLPDALKEWAQSDDGRHYVSAPANTGGGAEGKSSPNAKTITRSQFDQMDHVERANAAKEGIKITN